MTMSGDLPEVPLGAYHVNAHAGCDCTYCHAARQAGIQAHLDREQAKRARKNPMAMSGDLPEKRGGMQPDGSIDGCDCTYCQCARVRQAHDSGMRESREPTTREGEDHVRHAS